jgi:hypothetical protein
MTAFYIVFTAAFVIIMCVGSARRRRDQGP